MIRFRPCPFVAVTLLVLAALLAAGCEEDVAAVRNLDQPFSLYGVLSPQVDTQWVRVYAVEDRLQVTPSEPLDARMTSTDLTSDTRYAWRDSLFQEPSGQYAHVFWAPFRADYAHAYRLEVARSDGATSTVDVRIPERARLLPRDEFVQARGEVRVGALVEGTVDNVIWVEARYLVGWLTGFSPTGAPIFDFAPLTLPSNQPITETAGGLLVAADLAAAYQPALSLVPAQHLHYVPEWGVSLGLMTMTVDIANEAWTFPGGVFDSTALAQPGAFSNVEGGFGFVGGGYRVSTSWRPPDEAIEAAGFAVPVF
jgi:hypothetical protein